ncbi:hypothetical protein TSYNTROOL_16780 [Tepidanaerobacter syntrophicus]|nr:hypothetical protein TSYNTROOL_16780 [Tepidanaerobacter syntrophicus]
MPFSCSTIAFTSIPALRAKDIRRLVASDWDGHPPALPKFVNTSHIPFSSEFTVI